METHQPSFLKRLGIEPESWIKMTTAFEKTFKDLVGNPTLMDTANFNFSSDPITHQKTLGLL